MQHPDPSKTPPGAPARSGGRRPGRVRISRSLVYQLARRDLKQRYVGSLLGWLWTLIHPLVLLAVYTFVFRFAFDARLPAEEATGSYPLFLLAGMLPWLLVSDVLTRSATSLSDYAVLIKKSAFPPGAAPLSVAASAGIVHLLALGVLLGAAAWSGTLRWPLICLPLFAGLVALFSLGLAWIVAGLQAYWRDTAQVLAVVQTVWFWATPIVLPESFYRGRLDFALAWNPLAHAVRGYREAVLGGAWPEAGPLLILASAALGTFCLGGFFFRRAQRGFADVL